MTANTPRDVFATPLPRAIKLEWRGTGKFRVVNHYSVYRFTVEGARDWRLRPIDWQLLTTVKARAWDFGRYQYIDETVQPGTTYLYSLSLTLLDVGLMSAKTDELEVRSR